MKSEYNIDAKFERNIIQYLKDNKIPESIGLAGVHFTDDYNSQKQGVDFSAMYRGRMCYVDVKSIASDFPTFSQEVMNTVSRNAGWMFNNKLQTTHILYTYHVVEGASNYAEGKRIVADDPSKIIRTECILVPKKKVQDDIKKHLHLDCDVNTARSIAKAIETQISKGAIRTTEPCYRFKVVNDNKRALRKIEKWETKGLQMWITRSNNVAEHPINIVVRKQELIKLSTEHKIVNHQASAA